MLMLTPYNSAYVYCTLLEHKAKLFAMLAMLAIL